MPNRASKKGHIPKRSCVICRKKDEKSNLQRFIIKNGNIIFDENWKMFGRGFYHCKNSQCVEKLAKWLKKRKKKS
ncbi:MAG: DUF448 domain-containing protein [Candidatus Cloacimonetes bacterium]|nr:DUF448 domain-containing protein [Candidatus Cloacimonadota bacterium]MBL7108613.1 DUF448 domain-containing protein [Candidatus Cloacimonadota bacterium]